MATSNRSAVRFLGLLIAAACVFAGYAVFYWLDPVRGVLITSVTLQMAETAWGKVTGHAPSCPWSSLWQLPGYESRELWTRQAVRAATILKGEDRDLGIQRFDTPAGEFWIKRSGSLDGEDLIWYLVADHDILAAHYPDHAVRPGDIVLDCGAHVGVYTRKALQLGATKVVAIEPDPLNLECLRRNLAKEVSEGRVVIYAKGVWSSETVLTLHESMVNSGNNSVVLPNSGASIPIPLTTIDRLVDELGLPTVDYIKMDIEGAEREALAGARNVLRKCHPRLMLDSYHREDDVLAFRKVILSAEPAYTYVCTTCEEHFRGIYQPHVTFWHVSRP